MARIALVDSDNWFDDSKAIAFREGQRFDGRNQVSLATGDQWHHECLYLTRSGRWVLNDWSDWQGGDDIYREITPTEAAQWLLRNEWDFAEALERVPQRLRAALEETWASAEI